MTMRCDIYINKRLVSTENNPPSKHKIIISALVGYNRLSNCITI